MYYGKESHRGGWENGSGWREHRGRGGRDDRGASHDGGRSGHGGRGGRDGYRVLVDRLWPRGISKEKASWDEWLKNIAPSTALRQWFAHDPVRWDAFRKKYDEELDGNGEAVSHLLRLARKGKVTLHNEAAALRDYLLQRFAS